MATKSKTNVARSRKEEGRIQQVQGKQEAEGKRGLKQHSSRIQSTIQVKADVKDYSQHPVVQKKAEDVKEMISTYPLPGKNK